MLAGRLTFLITYKNLKKTPVFLINGFHFKYKNLIIRLKKLLPFKEIKSNSTYRKL